MNSLQMRSLSALDDIATLKDLRITHDGVHGRAYLVAHIGNETTLRLKSDLRLQFGFFEGTRQVEEIGHETQYQHHAPD